MCDDPVDIDNGRVTFNGTLVGDMANYTCDLGFELIGNTTTTCTVVDMDSGVFQPAPPSCMREYTEYKMLPVNNDYLPSSVACVNNSMCFGLESHQCIYVHTYMYGYWMESLWCTTATLIPTNQLLHTDSRFNHDIMLMNIALQVCVMIQSTLTVVW